MVQIQFPDGAVRPYEKGITALGIAKSISEGLAKKVLAASVNGEVYDATRPIETDAALKLANKGTPQAISQATKMIQDIGKESGLMAKLLGTVRQWIPKLIDIIDNIPLGKLIPLLFR